MPKVFYNIADHLGFALKIHKIKTFLSSTLKKFNIDLLIDDNVN